MAESNVMGTYKFPPNVFDKILDNFSQAVQDGKYHKLDYVFWRKLKTSKNSVRIVVKSDLNGKIFFEVFPDTYIMNSFFAGGIDGSFGEFLADNVCNIFTNDYAIECSEKFLEYKMKKAKKTVEKNNDISKTRDDLDYLKVYEGWNTEFSCKSILSDEDIQRITKELNTTPITVVSNDDCATGKVASIDSNAIFTTTLTSASGTTTIGSRIDAIEDKCAMIDNDYIDNRVNKVLNEQNTFNNNVDNKKGNKKMWYNYCGEPAGETEEEAREFAKNEMSMFDLIESIVAYGGYDKYLRWCLSQDNFWEEFDDDIIASDDIYFRENFTERDEEE